VDENIWANSKFRLCLRVQDRQDSMDMLHRVEAAYLTQAGRCYLQVGNDEIFELFQSGWSGASYDKELGSGSLLIAQMLSVTGKVDLAGNRAKAKRKELMKRHWLEQLIGSLEAAEAETGVNAQESGVDFQEQQDFREAFYRALHAVQPEFEESDFNNARLQDFIDLYRETDGGKDERVSAVMALEASGNKRLPEVRSKTQLEVVADYLRGVTEEQGTKKVRKLWLPVLPTSLYLDSMDAFRRAAFDGENWPEKPLRFHLSAVIGWADDPANQAQFPISLDFAQGGHHLLIGTVSTGKSTFAQSVVYSLMCAYSPDLLNVYCLDFSAKMLSVFADAPHVGGYLDEDALETDSLSKFFTMMSRILDERKARYAGTSFADAMNHDGWNDPAILIVIDNYGNFHEKTEERFEAQVSRIVKEGNAYGVYMLVTAGGISMQEIPSRMAENFRTALTLELPDPFAYGEVLHVIRPDVLPEARVKGRGLVYHGDRILEFQTALAAPSKDGRVGAEEAPDGDKRPPIEAPERNDRIKEAVKRMKGAWTGVHARKIPHIPEKPTRGEFVALEDYRAALANPALLPVGYNFADAGVYSLNLVRNFAYLVSGTRGSGKSVLMRNVMLTCADRNETAHIVELGSSGFKRIAEEHGWKRYDSPESVAELILWLKQECLRRDKIKAQCRARNASNEELFDAAQQNERINLFIATPLALAEELSKPDDYEAPKESVSGAADADASKGAEAKADKTPEAKPDESEPKAETPAPKLAMSRLDQNTWLSMICERGVGYNLFIYAEVSDRDLDNNLQGVGIPWFSHLADYQSGIRFGGMLNKQHDLLPFQNVDYRDEGYQSSVKAGIGFVATDRSDEPKTRVVVPMV
jgi:S-DNA-T family DNA segregation ATPase FtsK/SpoIIIE